MRESAIPRSPITLTYYICCSACKITVQRRCTRLSNTLQKVDGMSISYQSAEVFFITAFDVSHADF